MNNLEKNLNNIIQQPSFITIMKIGRIYKVLSDNGNEIYIGSTFNTTMGRFKEHEYHYNRWKKAQTKDNISVFGLFDKYGIDNCKIILIKEYEVYDRKQLEVYETLWINKLRLNCVNKHQPFCIKKLYTKQNKERIQQYHQKYYKKNKKQFQQYRQQNQKKLKEKTNCICGGKYNYCDKSIHFKTQKHQKWLKTQNQKEINKTTL